MSTENTGVLSADSAADALLAARTPETPENEPAAVETTAEVADAAPEEAAEQESETSIEAQDEQIEVEVDEVAAEAAETPSIEPPAFWSKAAKDAFSKLDPDAQREFVKSEKAREAEVTRLQQEAARERQAIAEAQAAIEHERQQYLEALQSQLPQPPDESLIDQDPVEYLRQKAAFEKQVTAFEKAFAEQQKAQAEAAKKAAAEQAEWLKAEAQKLADPKSPFHIPGFADEARGPEVRKELATYAQSLGFEAEALSQISAAEANVLWKAQQWDKAQQRAREAKAKPIPKVGAPGVSRSKAEQAADQRKAALARLSRTGSIEDAVALIRL